MTQKRKAENQLAVGCKLSPTHFALVREWADFHHLSVGQFLKGALALRIAALELGELALREEATGIWARGRNVETSA